MALGYIPHTKNSHEFRYRETISGVVQPWTAWIQCNDTNSTVNGDGFNVVIGNKNISIGDFQIRVKDTKGYGWPEDRPVLSNDIPFTSTTNITPVPPVVTGDDSANTLQATSQYPMVYSTANGAYVDYNGSVILTGDVSRIEGYWKFKVKAGAGRDESTVVNSPAFTATATTPSNPDAPGTSVNLTSDSWSAEANNIWLCTTLTTRFNVKIPANQEGFIQQYISGPSNSQGGISALGLDTDNTLDSFTEIAYSVRWDSADGGKIVSYANGVQVGTSDMVGAFAGYLRLKRATNGTVTSEKSTNGGSSWSVLHNFGSNTADLFLKGTTPATNGVKMYQPRATGVVSANTQPPSNYDADAQAYFTANNGLTTTQKDAWNTFVVSMKTDSLWTKMKAVYPYIGGTAASNAINAKTPGTHDITWSGGTFNAVGPVFDGSFKGITNINISQADSENVHISAYSVVNNAGTGFTVDIGKQSTHSGGNGTFYLASGTEYGLLGKVGYEYLDNVGNPNTIGHFVLSCVGANHRAIYKNGAVLTTRTSNNPYTEDSYIIMIGGSDDAGNSSRPQAFSSIGQGLSDLEVSTFNTHVTTLLTALNKIV